jgi:hypothetical protein
MIRSSGSSSSTFASEVSIELARGNAVSLDDSASFDFPAGSQELCAPESDEYHATAQPSNRNAMRRRANTGNLRRRYALPETPCHPSKIPIPVAPTERKLPSEGDIHGVLSASSKSNIPISTRMRQLNENVSLVFNKADTMLEGKNINVPKSKKGAKKAAVILDPKATRQPYYNTRSAVRIANKAGCLR